MQGSEPELKTARRGYSVSYKNKTLLSTIDPVAQAERAASEAGGKDRTLYLCPSPLLGYGLDILLSVITEDSAVLCVETDKKLFSLSETYINKNLLNHPKFAFTAIRDGEELFAFIRKKWGARVFRRVEKVRLTGGWQLDSEFYEEAEELIRSGFATEWGNAMVLSKLGRRFICNLIRNIANLPGAKPVTDLHFGSKPVLVLGAGPSLDPLLDNLQKAGIFETKRKNFFLVCVDTALSSLKERGIKPDLAVILESQFWNMRDFIGSLNTGIPAAVDISAYPGSLKLLGGQIYIFFTPWTKLGIFDRLSGSGFLPPSVEPLGSVGLAAVDISRRISSGLILIGGIDFSYTIDSLHARSCPAHISRLLAQNRFSRIFNAGAVVREGVFNTFSKINNPVKSDPAMRTYCNLFKKEFSGDNRIKDIAGNGLSLGLETLSTEKTAEILGTDFNDGTETNEKENYIAESRPGNINNISGFIKNEKELLEKLRSILTGTGTEIKCIDNKKTDLETLLDQADYLWSHFPDCAGTEGRRPPSTDLIFLKRVRAEIDPFIKLWELAGRETAAGFN